MSHTPGPWVAYTYAINKNLATVCADDSVICNVVDGHLANARLIAAAPDLLIACEKLLPLFESAAEKLDLFIDNWYGVDLARQAIAKAKGEK